eukprot:251893_1
MSSIFRFRRKSKSIKSKRVPKQIHSVQDDEKTDVAPEKTVNEKMKQYIADKEALKLIDKLPVFHDSQKKLQCVLSQLFKAESNISSTKYIAKLQLIKHEINQWQNTINEYKQITHSKLLSQLKNQIAQKNTCLNNVKNQKTANNSVWSHSKLAAYNLKSQLKRAGGQNNYDSIQQKLNFIMNTIKNNENFDKECGLSLKNIKRHLAILEKNVQSMFEIIDHEILKQIDAKIVILNSKIMKKEMEITKEWNKWNTAQVIEWIEYIENGKFMEDKYQKLFDELKNKKMCGSDLNQMNDLFLRGIILYKIDRNILLDHIHLLISNKICDNDHDSKMNEDMNLCVICSVNYINTVAIPCMHLCLCWDCYESEQSLIKLSCPICQQKCQTFKKCYLQGFH